MEELEMNDFLNTDNRIDCSKNADDKNDYKFNASQESLSDGNSKVNENKKAQENSKSYNA